jgi:hypothetical protein
MTPTETLTEHLRVRPAAPEPVGDADPAAIEAAVELARGHAAVHALLRTLVDRDTSFALFDVELYPALLARRPPREGAASEREIAVARSGAGDLYVWSADTGAVRLLDHERDFAEASTSASFDAFLESVLWSCLELIEADELDAADEGYLARVKLAVEIAGVGALEDDVRAKLGALGVVEG